jgi:hypothetical protein
MSKKVKLAEALLRRKELQEKVNVVKNFKDQDIFEVKAKRVNVTENVDDFIAKVPKLQLAEVTKEFDHYARQLRLIDAAIQQANWTAEIEVDAAVFQDIEIKEATAKE